MNQQTIHEQRIQQVQAYRKSGMTAREWCIDNQMNINTLKYWLRKDRQTQEDNNPQWVSLTPEIPEHTSLTIRIGTAAIEVNSGVDPQLLRQVIGILQATC